MYSASSVKARIEEESPVLYSSLKDLAVLLAKRCQSHGRYRPSYRENFEVGKGVARCVAVPSATRLCPYSLPTLHVQYSDSFRTLESLLYTHSSTMYHGFFIGIHKHYLATTMVWAQDLPLLYDIWSQCRLCPTTRMLYGVDVIVNSDGEAVVIVARRPKWCRRAWRE